MRSSEGGGRTILRGRNRIRLLPLRVPRRAAAACAVGILSLTLFVGPGAADHGEPHKLTITDATVVEGNSGTTIARFTVTLAPALTPSEDPPLVPITVAYATEDGTATAADADYVATVGALTFGAEETSKTIEVPVNGDTRDEADETFAVRLSGAVGAEVEDGSATGTIRNDDDPTLSISDASPAAVAEADGATASFTVTLSACSREQVTADYATGGGSATAGQDYESRSGTLTFPATPAGGTCSEADRQRTITVAAKGDALDEDNETFAVTLTNATNAGIARAQGTGTIEDNDASPRVAIADAGDVTEGNSGSTTASFVVTLVDSNGERTRSGRNVSVGCKTAGESATAGEDFASVDLPTCVTLSPGQEQGSILIRVIGDTAPESTERFTLQLQNPVNATIARGTGTATIIDNDSGSPGPAKPQCSDGVDNDSDGKVDSADPGCSSATDTSEAPDPSGTPQCSDGRDNDNDGKVDADDPGCTGPTDTSEADGAAAPQCSDGRDNDNDGKVDDADPGCSGPTDTTESPDPSTTAQCSDKVDNDGDGKIDYPADPGCQTASDTSESPDPSTSAQCSDKVDNDGDGKTDFPADPGCQGASDNTESPDMAAQCSDGLDNDADGATDFPEDAGCESVADTTEAPNPTNPNNKRPTASFTVSTPVGQQDEPVTFRSTSTDSDGTIRVHAWNFGDGSTATGATATHAFTRSGIYLIKLTVTDSDGAQATAERYLTVGPKRDTTPPPPIVFVPTEEGGGVGPGTPGPGGPGGDGGPGPGSNQKIGEKGVAIKTTQLPDAKRPVRALPSGLVQLTLACPPDADGPCRGTLRLETLPATRRIACRSGSSRRDSLAGTAQSDCLSALGGNDRADGRAGDDAITGGAGADRLSGAAGNDRLDGGADRDLLFGGAGSDVLLGGAGADVLDAGAGRDVLVGGSGVDRLLAGAGNDIVDARDGNAERVDCGPGTDAVRADPTDRLVGCERRLGARVSVPGFAALGVRIAKRPLGTTAFRLGSGAQETVGVLLDGNELRMLDRLGTLRVRVVIDVRIGDQPLRRLVQRMTIQAPR